MNTNILGAGMAGLLAANMMRRKKPLVVEAKADLPDLHKAVLRFRNTSVSDVTGIPFEKIRVDKSMMTERGFVNQPTVFDANNYSLKATGGLENRSVWNLEKSQRYLAPDNFVELMASSTKINFGIKIGLGDLKSFKEEGDLTISTIPMPIMMGIVGWDSFIDFKANCKPIWVLRATLKRPLSKIHQTIYNTDISTAWYRGSIHRGDLMIECDVDPTTISDYVVESFIKCLCNLPMKEVVLTEPTCHMQPLGKILSIDEQQRKDFIWHLTQEYNIYSLGRFATWRNLLLDSIVSDVRVIEKLSGTSHYNHNQKQNNK